MKARASVVCFGNDSRPRNVLLRRRASLISFAMSMSFCVPECHQNRVKSSTGEEGSFLVSPFAFEGKTDKGNEIAIAIVCLPHFKQEDLSSKM